jgi:tetratricopeptide (TPR) repeat protein
MPRATDGGRAPGPERGPVFEFCLGLRQLRIESDTDVTVLAKRLNLSRTQLYAVLAGRVKVPPDWDRVVRPLVEACTENDSTAVAAWRRRHAILTGVWEELRHRDRQAGSPDGHAPPAAVPRQLPPVVPGFEGRGSELAALTAILNQSVAEATIVISAIAGTAGVGKTALAVRWAHQVADRFPDGQLYVDLRGYDPGQPATAASALGRFLRDLGIYGPGIPSDEEELAARYRSQLTGRRMLILLDNAGSEEQVRPLLPAAAGCAVVVTSRDALAGLVARDGARRVDLDLLPVADATALLHALIGPRAAVSPAATEALAELACRLPLALRVAAELAVARPAAPMAELVAELADRRRRLDLLAAGSDSRTAVRAVFSWSLRHLDPAAARVFRLAGLHPGPDLDQFATAALTGCAPEQAGQMLGQLARAHLMQPVAPGRYGMHDLLRAYAREVTAAEDGPDGQRAALTRLFDYYLHTAAAAIETLFPADRRPRVPPPASPAPLLADPAAALAWLDTERASLTAIAARAADHGWPGHATRLAATLNRYLDGGGHYPEAIAIHGCARSAAREAGDVAAEAEALNALGVAYLAQGALPRAKDHLRQALGLWGETRDQTGEARAHLNLAIAEEQLGRGHQAISHLGQALALFREAGDRIGEVRALNNLGVAGLLQGRYQQATSHLEQALALLREAGDRTGEAYALHNLGDIELRQGRYQQAASYLEQAMAVFRQTGDRPREAGTLNVLGGVELRQGRYRQAASHLRQALALHRQTGYRAGEAEALNGLGEALLAAERPLEARRRHAMAVAVACRAGDKYQQARGRHGLGNACQAAGDPGQARHHWQQALALFTGLNAPEAGQVRAQLATNDSPRDQLSLPTADVSPG